MSAERSVIGSIFLSEGGIPPRINGLEPHHFEDHRLGEIHRAMCQLSDDAHPVDEFGVSRLLGGKPTAGELVTFADHAVGVVAVEHHADGIKKTARRRSYITAIKGAMGALADSSADADETTADLIDKLSTSAIGESQDHTATAAELIKAEFAALEKRRADPNSSGLSTGYDTINEAIGGMQPGSLIIVAGRPSMGKTALAQNISDNVSKDGGCVHTFSLEMSKEQFTQRSIASESRINLKRYMDGDLKDTDWPKASKAMGALASKKSAVCGLGTMSISRLRVLAKQRAVSFRPDLIVVDYLQLMGGDGRNREEEVARMSRGLKLLAKEMACPVLAVAQLNRAVEGRGEKIPLMSDLRESGSIEQDADVVMLIYRDDYYNQENSDRPGIADINVAKNRNGPTGTFQLKWVGECTRFDDLRKTEGWRP